jgi:hypothetical protein
VPLRAPVRFDKWRPRPVLRYYRSNRARALLSAASERAQRAATKAARSSILHLFTTSFQARARPSLSKVAKCFARNNAAGLRSVWTSGLAFAATAQAYHPVRSSRKRFAELNVHSWESRHRIATWIEPMPLLLRHVFPTRRRRSALRFIFCTCSLHAHARNFCDFKTA